eukprot:353952-Chlamydomonas_euryale.AAC.2
MAHSGGVCRAHPAARQSNAHRRLWQRAAEVQDVHHIGRKHGDGESEGWGTIHGPGPGGPSRVTATGPGGHWWARADSADGTERKARQEDDQGLPKLGQEGQGGDNGRHHAPAQQQPHKRELEQGRRRASLGGAAGSQLAPTRPPSPTCPQPQTGNVPKPLPPGSAPTHASRTPA